MRRPFSILVALLFTGTAFAQAGGLKLKPAPDAAPATAPAKAEERPASPGETNAGVEMLEKIFACLAAGLPKDWRTATVEVIEIASKGAERQFEAKYTHTRASESKPVPLVPCDTTSPAKSVHGLNDFLEPEKRQWKRAMLIFNSDGKFELKYDYAQ